MPVTVAQRSAWGLSSNQKFLRSGGAVDELRNGAPGDCLLTVFRSSLIVQTFIHYSFRSIAPQTRHAERTIMVYTALVWY